MTPPPMLHYINRIDAVAAMHLAPALILPALRQAILPEYVPLRALPLSGLAALEVTAERADGRTLHTARLTALLAAFWEPPGAPAALILHTVRGGAPLLMGTSQRPFPTLLTSLTCPDRASQRAACTLQAAWTAALPPLRLIRG